MEVEAITITASIFNYSQNKWILNKHFSNTFTKCNTKIQLI